MEITQNISTDSINKLCRICLNECDSMNNIHHNENIFEISIIELLRTSLSLQIDENEALPNLICPYCETEVYQIYAFKLKFEKSDDCLKNYLNYLENEEDNKEQIILIVKDEMVDGSSIVGPYYASVLDLDENAVEVIEESLDEAETRQDLVEPLKDIEDTSRPQHTHKCKRCNEEFESKLKLIDHRRKTGHYYKKTVTCSVCNTSVPSQNYKSHFLKHSYKFQCEFCSKTFSNSFNLRRHLLIHTRQTPYKCEVCGTRFARRDKLKDHMMIHTGEKPFKCGICGLRFRTREKVNLHKLRKCNKNDDDESDSEKYKRKHACDICSKSFKLVSSLLTHKLLHTDERVICNYCGKPYANEKKLKEHQRMVHLRKPKGKEFLCYICAKQYSSKILLQRHILTHLGLSKLYKCNVCGKGFTQSGSLALHSNIHTGEKPYICHICSRAFNRPSNLQRHIQQVHENVRPFSCNICGKQFTVKASLTVHVRIHTGEKPYSCDICEKKFVDSGSLNKHKKRHNNCTNE